MSTYFVNAAGLSIFPYDTVAKGAVNFKTLLDNIVLLADDIIEVCEDGGTIDDSVNNPSAISVPITIRSYSGNTNKPVIKARSVAVSDYLFEFDNSTFTGLKIQNLKIFQDSVDSEGFLIRMDGSTIVDLEISGCELWAEDPQDFNSYAIWFGGVVSGNSKIENNIIYQMAYGIYIPAQINAIVIQNNHIYDIPRSIVCNSGLGNTNIDIQKNKIHDSAYPINIYAPGSNINIINNIIYNCTGTGIQVGAGGDLDNVNIISNSIRFITDGWDGIQLYGDLNVTNSTVTNNIVDCNAVCRYGLRFNYIKSSCVVDYNIISDYINVSIKFYNSEISYGPNNLRYDTPVTLFVSSTDLHLLPGSLALDAGAGNGIYSVVPTDDYDGLSRPFVLSGYNNADDGTDMGAYEMRLSDGADHYVYDDGSNTPPFDTLETAANTLLELVDGVTLQNNDIISVVGTIDEDVGYAIIDKKVVIRSYSYNVGKAIIKAKDNSIPVRFRVGADESVIQDVILYKVAAAPCMGDFIEVGSGIGLTPVNNVEISRCEFYFENPSNDLGSSSIHVSGNNTKIKNCLFYDIYCGISIFLSNTEDVTGLQIINNTFRNINMSDAFNVTHGGVVARSDPPTGPYPNTEFYFYNNIVDGYGGTSYDAFDLRRMDSGHIDYNCYNNLTSIYNDGIDTSVIGDNNINGDPIFRGVSDLHLQIGSPCLDAGIGVSTYSGIPVDDYDGVSRPFSLRDYINADDGTDIGAYENIPLSSATRYINPGGLSISPFDTPEKGAINFKAIVDALQDDDIIEVVDNGEIIETGTYAFIENKITIRSYQYNVNKPIIQSDQGQSYVIRFQSQDDCVIQDLKFYRSNPLAQMTIGAIIGAQYSDNLLVERCEFYIENQNSMTMTSGIEIADCNYLKVKNCIFHDIYTGVGIMLPPDTGTFVGYEIINNTFRNINMFNAWSIYGGVIGGTYTPTPPHPDLEVFFYNNIVDGYNGGTYACMGFKSGISGQIDYNCFNNILTTKYDPEIPPGMIGTHNKDVDPLFMSVTDLQLQDNSPCIDAGAGTGIYSGVPTDDIIGIPRPVLIHGDSSADDGTDIGAYEAMRVSMLLDVGSAIDVSAGDVSFRSVVIPDAVELLNSVSSDSNFLSSSKWKEVIVIYEHNSGQNKKLVHKLRGMDWYGYDVFPTFCNGGTWRKNKLILIDGAGDMLTVERDEIGDDEDIIIDNGSDSSVSSASESSMSSESSESSESSVSSESSESSVEGGG
jgi:hypothetical protein